MAKRKRLSPAAPEIFGAVDGSLETKNYTNTQQSSTRSLAPIADVSGDASLRAALDEVSAELTSARSEGRLVLRLALDVVDPAYLVRDRIELVADEMDILLASLRARGQQTPIEVVNIGGGRYGLISGWRRLTALKQLYDETGEARFAYIQALVRSPETAAAAYLAMIEENEIRAGLSFYERARIAVQAVRQGVHDDSAQAVQALFAAARAPKRSKILSFVTLVEVLDTQLRFPAAIPEKLGLALVGALRGDKKFKCRLSDALHKADPQTPEAERTVLAQCLKVAPEAQPDTTTVEIVPGIALTQRAQRLTLSGPNVTTDLSDDLRHWLVTRASRQ